MQSFYHQLLDTLATEELIFKFSGLCLKQIVLSDGSRQREKPKRQTTQEDKKVIKLS